MILSIPPHLLYSVCLNTSFIAHFCLFFAVLLAWTLLSGVVLNKLLRLPAIAGMILGGIVLGPSCIDVARYALFAEPVTMIDVVTGESYTILSSDLFIFFVLLISAACTVPYLLWLAGFETDLKELMHVGLVAVIAGVCGAVLPIAMIFGVLYYGLPYYAISQVASVGVGLIFAATSVSIPVAMLYAAGKMHLKSSKATLGAAVVDDIVAVIMLSFFMVVMKVGNAIGNTGGNGPGTVHTMTLFGSSAYLIATLAILMACGYVLVRPCIRWLKESAHVSLLAPVATGIMLVYFGFSELFGGLAGITGAYFAGLFYRMGIDGAWKRPEDAHHCAQQIIAPFTNTVLLPLFLGSIGLQVNIHVLSTHHWGLVLVLLIVAVISKMAGCFLAAALNNSVSRQDRWTMVESYLFGSAMVARGEVGLVIASILKGASVISLDLYVVSVVVTVLTTIVTPIMLAAGFYWYDRKYAGV